MMLSLILALVCAFVGSLFLFGGMMLTVPKKEDFEFKDRLRAYQASSTFGDVIESTDLACSFMSAALFIGGTYLPNEPTWMSTLELAFAIFFAVNFFFCLYIAANKIKYLRSLQAAVDLITVFPMLLLFIFTGDPSGAGLSSASGVLRVARIMKMMRTLKLFRLARGSMFHAIQKLHVVNSVDGEDALARARPARAVGPGRASTFGAAHTSAAPELVPPPHARRCYPAAVLHRALHVPPDHYRVYGLRAVRRL